MKTAKLAKMMTGVLAAGLAWCAMADGSAISDVVVRQRWPWSRLVDIDYVLTCDSTQRVDVVLAAKDGSDTLTLPLESLSGDLYNVTHGPRRIIWDPTKTAYTNSQMLTQFSVTLTPTPAPLYMVVDLSGGTSATSYPVTHYLTIADVPGDVTNDLYKTTHLLLRRIPSNTFIMGESPTTFSVTLTKAFYAGVYEVTQKQWQQVMGNWPAYWNNAAYRDTRPVEYVTYDTIRGATNSSQAVDWPKTGTSVLPDSFMGRIRAKTGIDGFDLPTEAQWECLCRAGTRTYYNDGLEGIPNATSNAQADVLGRYKFNGGYVNGETIPRQDCGTTNATAAVGSYKPNEWGLYDTHGNVWEWCRDWHTNSFETTAVTDPTGGGSGSRRVLRGGWWGYDAANIRSARRGDYAPSSYEYHTGFRLVMTLP